MHHETDNVVMVYAVEFHDLLHSSQWYYAPYSFDKEVLSNLLDKEAQTIKEKLEQYADMMRHAKVHGTVKSIHANRPGEGIVIASKEVEADIIITGCRGTGKIRRTFLGSCSDYVLHHSEVPVIVCRHKGDHHHHHHVKH
ncbi:hypothetical protein FSP39_008039 [Pinctada imbricata]|uniref:UspA domain-containing protein n=1 Tax=Pinctada imbricata TaxID=66713 RepID=A0AA89C6Z3_PINIB|nr:hypothetical protein FSP39_008039 [Pinctada imbricata]